MYHKPEPLSSVPFVFLFLTINVLGKTQKLLLFLTGGSTKIPNQQHFVRAELINMAAVFSIHGKLPRIGKDSRTAFLRQKRFNRHIIDFGKRDKSGKIRRRFSRFIIGVSGAGAIQNLRYLTLCITTVFSQLSQLFPKLQLWLDDRSSPFLKDLDLWRPFCGLFIYLQSGYQIYLNESGAVPIYFVKNIHSKRLSKKYRNIPAATP